MDYKEIIQQTKKKIFSPIYVLHGEEPYFIDLISDYIEDHALDPAERDFNQTVLYGRDVKWAELIALAKGFPMMANYQVIIVKEAQNIYDIETFFEALSLYLQNPQKTTILVLCVKYKKLDARRKYMKVIQSAGILYEAPRVYDNQVPGWVNAFVKEEGYKIGEKASMLLSEFIGNNLSRIANELNKLYILTPKGEEITPDLIEKNIGISKDYNMLELYKSVAFKKHEVTFKIIDYFGQNLKENPPEKVIPMLFSFFNKVMIYHNTEVKSDAVLKSLFGYFQRDVATAAQNYSMPKLLKIFDALREYDLKSKGVNAANVPKDQLLMEMIIKVVYVM